MATIFHPDSPQTRRLDAVVSQLEALEAQERAIQAAKFAALAEATEIAAVESGSTNGAPSGSRGDLAMRVVRAEIAAALHLSEATVERHLDIAFRLTERFSGMLNCLRTGEISEAHARVMLDAATVIGADDSADTVARRKQYESAVLEVATTETPNRLRPIARRIAESLSTRSVDERHREARALRCVRVEDRDEGMADLIAHLPAATAHGIYNRLVGMSRIIAEAEARADAAPTESSSAVPGVEASGPGHEGESTDSLSNGAVHEHGHENELEHGPNTQREQRAHHTQRARSEIRADLLADLLLRGGHDLESGTADLDSEALSDLKVGGVKAQVQVIIPVTVLSEQHDKDIDGFFAELTGHGPLDSETARELAGTSEFWNLVRVDDITGGVLSVERYRPSEQMRRILAARDQHCRFPGCRAPLSRCDVDHTIDAQHGGPTVTTNLAHLCRGHHTLKHHGRWRVEQDDQGSLSWKSPTGRTYLQRPPSRVVFRAVRE